jgi:putative addiction module component (TIGR02574 family)
MCHGALTLAHNTSVRYLHDMANIGKVADILRLSVAERLALSAAIWESLAEEPDTVPVPDWHLEILAERLAEDDKDGKPAQSWSDLRRKIEQGG